MIYTHNLHLFFFFHLQFTCIMFMHYSSHYTAHNILQQQHKIQFGFVWFYLLWLVNTILLCKFDETRKTYAMKLANSIINKNTEVWIHFNLKSDFYTQILYRIMCCMYNKIFLLFFCFGCCLFWFWFCFYFIHSNPFE